MANTLFSLPPDSVPQFDELYVISDLHLGGPANFQIFNSGTELERLIDYLRTTSPDNKIALLINGDFVDFLAELPALHFDPAGAIKKLLRIATEDPSFTPVFDALKKFTNTENRRLILNLGNHDLELALPWVRARLLTLLSGGNETACGRITFAFDGMGFPCKVGNATVLCVHGNEVDTWNVADYEMIRQFGLEVTHGRPIESWIPNAGSQLVIDVMNDLKRKYPFIDLLKPETQAAVPTLLALAPDQHDKLRAIGATVRRLAWDKIKRLTGFLGSEGEDLTGRTAAAIDSMATRSSYFAGISASEFDRQQYAEMLLDDAEERLHRGVSPMTLIGNDELGSYLGLTSAVM
jgi:UDP-2,3-diacylglucosamine pyrophosphatase LpxH